MTPRQESILSCLVKEYIDTAEPIGSKMLENSGDFDVSSATIRSEMHNLEDMGYLVQPHTSAGRIPTTRAYRHFVDNLASHDIKITRDAIEKIANRLENSWASPDKANRTLAKLLSDLSGAVVITNITGREDFYKTGISGLMELPEFREFEQMIRLTNFFDEFENLFNTITQDFFGIGTKNMSWPFRELQNNSDIKIIIGEESPIKEMSNEAILLGQYCLPQSYVGSLTLIGPARMDYAKNIGLIRFAMGYMNKLAQEGQRYLNRG